MALTFDLDMTPGMAMALRLGLVRSWVNQDALRVLEENKVHATLFMTGMWAETYPALARQLASNPQFEIANHSYSHPAFHSPCYRLASLIRNGAAAEIARAQAVITQVTGVQPRYFRFPGGCYDTAALNAVSATGLIPIGWSVNSADAFNSFPIQIAGTVLAEVKPGSIVIMHLHGGPNAPATGAVLRLIIPVLVRQGYEFVTVSELLARASAISVDPRSTVQVYQPPSLKTAAPRPCWVWSARRHTWIRC